MRFAPSSTTTVDNLLTGVQRALRAIVPIADDLGIRWREPANYLDWDSIANGIFEGIALAAIRSSSQWMTCLPLIAYDRRVTDYSQFSYIAVKRSDDYLPLVCLETTTCPFDTCLLAELGAQLEVGGHIRVPFDECRFFAVRRLPLGSAIRIQTLNW